jgi:hypothetical protein
MIHNLENRIRAKLPEVYEHIIANGVLAIFILTLKSLAGNFSVLSSVVSFYAIGSLTYSNLKTDYRFIFDWLIPLFFNLMF